MFVKMKKAKKDVVAYNIKGKITHTDYEKLIPKVEKVIEEFGKVKFLVDITGFETFTMEAMMDDGKFFLKHNKDISKIAIIGNNKLEEMLMKFSDFVTPGEMKYFDSEDIDDAWKWIEG